MMNLDYIECDGVCVPSDWTLTQLKEALAKRKIRFSNEKEIMRVFGDAVQIKRSLEQRIHDLHLEVAKLETYIKRKTELTSCPKCGMNWTGGFTIKGK